MQKNGETLILEEADIYWVILISPGFKPPQCVCVCVIISEEAGSSDRLTPYFVRNLQSTTNAALCHISHPLLSPPLHLRHALHSPHPNYQLLQCYCLSIGFWEPGAPGGTYASQGIPYPKVHAENLPSSHAMEKPVKRSYLFSLIPLKTQQVRDYLFLINDPLAPFPRDLITL